MKTNEHLQLLKQGVEFWNNWRYEHSEIRPNLNGVDLNDACLSGANLASANLNGAILSGTILNAADLSDADLRNADLKGADLTEAYFEGATLTSAQLCGTTLSRATLCNVNLIGANLSRASLMAAKLCSAVLIAANLSEANLSDADLTDVDLGGAKLVKTKLVGADLSGADLNRANLTRANVSDADLSGADLSGADLSNAILRGAKLNGAKLNGAKLIRAHLGGAFLVGANLRGASLIGANLSRADLTHANLSSAGLSGADISNARTYRTVFANVDFQGVKGLEDVQHGGPSEISTSTLYRSEGLIPDVFLRGCGLKDWEIETATLYQTDLTPHQITDIFNKIFELHSDPLIQFNSCFISYSSADEKFAKHLYEGLQSKGVRCWFAPEDMKIGDRIRNRIDDSILLHDKLLLILSASSVASQWVEQEVETALEKEREQGREVLFPLRLDDTVMNVRRGWPALIKKTRHIGDFCHWSEEGEYKKGFERLLNALRVGT